MRRPSRTGLSWLFACCANIPLMAQDLESIGREKPFSFSGALSLNQLFYASSGIAPRRAPYSYVATGNISLSLYGWNVPLSFSVSNRATTFSQPFNQYSLHPTWKWATAHAGYTSMTYSPYTVNGHIFLGGGLDLNPEGKWTFSAFAGRLLKAVEADSTTTPAQTPSFQRMGYGGKISFGNGMDYMHIILFHARDDVDSILPPPDRLALTPQENTVVSAGAGKTILRHLALKGEVAVSALTRDLRAGKAEYDHPLARAGFLFQPRLSSSYYEAVKMSVDYQHQNYRIGIGYERIDPEYRTLGAYYFNNDLENITLNASLSFFQGKLSVTGSGGAQRDNIGKTKISSMRRFVGSVNTYYSPSERFSISAAWSAFQTYTHLRSRFERLTELTPYDSRDTLRFTQISQNASLTTSWRLPGAENKREVLTVNATLQEAADKQGNTQQHAGTTFYNVSVAYSLSLARQHAHVSFSINTSMNEGPYMRIRMLGPQASVQRSFLNRKLRVGLSSSYNAVHSNGLEVNRILNGRVNAVLSVRNRHQLQLSTVVARRSGAREPGSVSFTEFTSNLGYHYNFK